MPAPADLVITNISPVSITIQTHVITAGSSYTVVFADIVTFAKDPYLRMYVLTNQCTITVLGQILRLNAADTWLQNVALTTIVYAS